MCVPNLDSCSLQVSFFETQKMQSNWWCYIKLVLSCTKNVVVRKIVVVGVGIATKCQSWSTSKDAPKTKLVFLTRFFIEQHFAN